MKITISLSEAQANAVRALAQFARLTESDVLLASALIAWNMEWDEPEEFRAELMDNRRYAAAGDVGDFDSRGRLGCGVLAWQPRKEEIIARALHAACREEAKRLLGGPDALPRGTRFDPETGVIRLPNGWGEYRWTGRRIMRLEG